jgi:hypothetical protein
VWIEEPREKVEGGKGLCTQSKVWLSAMQSKDENFPMEITKIHDVDGGRRVDGMQFVAGAVVAFTHPLSSM